MLVIIISALWLVCWVEEQFMCLFFHERYMLQALLKTLFLRRFNPGMVFLYFPPVIERTCSSHVKNNWTKLFHVSKQSKFMRAHSLLIVRSANHVFIATKSKVMCKYGRCVVALKLVVLVVRMWDVKSFTSCIWRLIYNYVICLATWKFKINLRLTETSNMIPLLLAILVKVVNERLLYLGKNSLFRIWRCNNSPYLSVCEVEKVKCNMMEMAIDVSGTA